MIRRVAIFMVLLLLAGCAADDHLLRVISLRDHNTRIVAIGVTLLGLAAGVIGTYMVLRRRALVGDAMAHATLPGIAIAFLLATWMGGEGKSLPVLLLGAAASGLIGVGCILLLRRFTRLKEDAALGIVLSVFFGLGVALLSVIQRMPGGNQAGLESFIYGKTASMLASDAALIAWSALGIVALVIVLAKEFTILSFDAEFARAQGWPTALLDALMMAAVAAVTVIGLQAVGLILIIAMLIIPPAAARFWTDSLRGMQVIAAAIGAVSGLLGALLSASAPRLPAGAIIVLVAASMFLLSLVFGIRRGALVRAAEHWRLSRRVRKQHLLRAIYELHESAGDGGVSRTSLLAARSWSPRQLGRVLRETAGEKLIESWSGDEIRPTPRGLEEAARLARNHRLWELYLIQYADIAPSHVDRDADQIEHVLGPEMVARLESLLAGESPGSLPPSPHKLTGSGGRR